MNFFAAQDQARRSTRRLIFAYAVATVIIVLGVTGLVGLIVFGSSPSSHGYTSAEIIPILLGTALFTALFILGSSVYKTSVLSAGGGRVAVEMGGVLIPTDVQDPLRRRLRNVVEEMAIASGVPVPEIYVLEAEQGINAFAAGFSSGDAAIAVTRGTLELLDRDELQGVIAHEFSHILNGDMKLNIRLMGVLFGIMALGLIGRMILRGGYHASIVSSRRGRGDSRIMIVGLGLVILGAVGVFFARMIKAGVSRQREFLADASAVQFMRQTDGIAGALKKIGGYSEGSMITAADPEEVSHMLFGSGSRLAGVFATHPPLIERIQALDPSFQASDFPHVVPRQRQVITKTGARAAAFAGDVPKTSAGKAPVMLAESITESVGRPGKRHIEFARQLRQSIPELLYDAAHSSDFAYLLTIALVLDRSGKVLGRQFSLLREQLGAERANLVRRYYDELYKTGTRFRLPLLEIAFPALKLRPAPELAYLISLTSRLIEIDGEIELYEFCFYRTILSNLNQATNPAGRHTIARARRRELQAATISLLRILADYGHDTDADREAAFQTGIATLGPWAHAEEYESDRKTTISALNSSLDILLGLNAKGQESLLTAVSATAAHDGKLSVAEAEMIQAVCATLDYPLPPILLQ